MTTVDSAQLSQLTKLLRQAPTGAALTFRASRDTATRPVIEFFADMPEAERRLLAPEVLRLHKIAQAKLGLHADATSSEDPELSHTSIALVATATLAELRKLRSWNVSVAECQAMADRRPAWLAEGIELALERTQSGWAIGDLAHLVHQLVTQGLIAPPSHERYAIGIAYAYGSDGVRRFPKDMPLVACLRRDVDGIEPVIWRQFEVEGGGEISLANFEKFYARGCGWADALKTLSDENRLDRQRLLDASLDALNRGFSQYRAGWFSRFHEMMAPTFDERAARTDRYLDLLASPIGSTVSMAMAALRALQKADRIDAGLIAGRIEPALHASTAAAAKGALTLLTAAARSRPELRPAVVRVAAAGLEHSQSEVQEAALALIESRVEALEDGSRRAIADRLGVMSAKLRARAEALIGGQGAFAPSAPDVGAGIAELRARAERLPSDLRRLAGVDAALEGGGADIPRAAFTGMEIPRLDPAKAIVPVATFEELIDEALVAVEHSDDLDRVERVLAGALRFAVDRPPDEAKLLAPLAKSLKRYRPKSHDCSATPRGALQIVLSALFADEPPEFAVVETDPRAVMVLRTTAMQRAIGGRAARIQLSAPTHQGHWIDPLVLVERSRAADAKGAAPLLGIADQILALLRLAPDHRMPALDAAGAISGEWGAALRYALGGDAPFGTTRSLWVAAARARAPFDDDPRIAELMGAPLRGADQAPRFSYRTKSRPGGWLTVALRAGEGADVEFGKEGSSFTPPRPKLGIPVDPGRCFTTVALSDPAHLWHLDTYHPGNAFHAGSWAAALWPQHPEPVFALSAKAACMLDGNNYVRPANEPLADGLKLILDPDVPIGPMALLMLCRGLNAIDKGAAQATVDALIVLIDDGRLDGETLGAGMHELLMSGLVLPKRWPDRVKDVARSSKLALLAMRRAFERALHPGAPNGKLRDMHAWLEILLELSVEAGVPIEDPLARQSIAAYQDGGKAKNAARTLLELKPPQCQATRTSAAVHALRQRVMRGERWQKLLAE